MKSVAYLHQFPHLNLTMNSKAMEMAISTLIIIVLGILVLIGLVYMMTGGFKSFKETTDPFTDTAQSTAVRKACMTACDNTDRLTFCCNNYTLNNEQIKCSDARLEIDCSFSCADFQCTLE